MVDFLLLALFLPTAFAAFLPLFAPLMLFFAADFVAAFLAEAFFAGAFFAAVGVAGGLATVCLAEAFLTAAFFFAGAFVVEGTDGTLTGGVSNSQLERRWRR